MCPQNVNIPCGIEAFRKCGVSEKMNISCKFSCFSESSFLLWEIKIQLCNESFLFPEWFASKSWKLQITCKTRVSTFCLPMGLYWRLARRLKATLNLHWIEDTCLVLRISNMLAQLLEHSVQEPPRWGLAFQRVCLREECIKLLVVWPSDSFCPKTFFVNGVLAIMIAAFVQQLASCSASNCCETTWLI